LIYDKRGVGASTGDWTIASPTDLAMDALAGIRLLRARADVDSARVGIDGFSQGGWIAPLAATMSRDIAFVIVGSAAGLTPADQSIYDVAHALATAGFDSSVIARATALRRRLYLSSTDSLVRAALAVALDSVHAEPWFETSALPYPLSVTLPPQSVVDFLRLEPEPIWQRVTVPVLAYWGAHDQHLPAAEGMAVVRRGLASAHNSHLTVHMYPDADHGMVRVPRAAPWDFPRGVPYFQLIADWFDKN
jgi:dienelactone hydrolase